MAEGRSERRRARGECIQDTIDRLGWIFYEVTNWKNELLWYQSAPILQKLNRDVLDEVAFRWANNMVVPPWDTYTVKVRDNKAYIPRQGSRNYSWNYTIRYRDFILSVYGPVADNRLLDDFCRRLSDPTLTL
ncbi:uncharacterized protein LOC133742457 [Rosa rugosa]|uniref:uncharacterized protein LOC133742457 n=1 Tax=Rosa rugosa TaxID=74645 RepID=UPI002B40FE86|nr:uncharacterized protein LOC133742457 [Rosa rugosa]